MYSSSRAYSRVDLVSYCHIPSLVIAKAPVPHPSPETYIVPSALSPKTPQVPRAFSELHIACGVKKPTAQRFRLPSLSNGTGKFSQLTGIWGRSPDGTPVRSTDRSADTVLFELVIALLRDSDLLYLTFRLKRGPLTFSRVTILDLTVVQGITST